MGKYRYFELSEFIVSDVAKRRGIDNTPSFSVVERLDNLVANLLEPMRIAYGKPITVTSGYRCEKLNKAVGGVNGSAHMRGDAADLTASDMAGFKKFVREWLVKNRIKFDQCIIERKGNTEWIHVGIVSSTGSQRGQLFSMNA